MPTYSSSTVSYKTLRLVLTEIGTSVASNTSTIQYDLYVDCGSTYFSTVKIGAVITIDGTTVLNRAYSSSSQYSCSSNSSVKIASGTTTIEHLADGTKTINANRISASCSSAGIVASMNLTNGSSWTLTTIPRSSSVSTSAASTLMGTVRTISISSASSSFKHKLQYKFPSSEANWHDVTNSLVSSSYSWTVPLNLSANLTNADSGTGTIQCTTYQSDGVTQVGSPTTVSFTAKIPPSTIAPRNSTTEMGTDLLFDISGCYAYNNNISHTLEFKFGTQTSYTAISGTFSTTPTFNQARGNVKGLAAYVPADNSSGTGTMKVTTKNGTATVGTSTCSFTLKIPASSFSVTSASVTMGSNQTFTINPAASNIKHKLTYSFGSLTNQSIGTGIGSSKTWTVPTSLAGQLTNAKQGTVTATLTTYNGTAQCGSTSTATFTAVAPVSTMTLSASSLNLNSALTVTIARATTNMTHTLAYSFGGASGTIGSSLTTSASWTPAYTLAQQIPSATSGTCTLTLTTYIGSTSVGTSTKTLTLKVPNNSTTRPTLTSSTLSPSSSLSSPFNNIFIANYTKLRATVSASGKYNATIASYEITVDGVTKSQASSPVTTANNLTTSGTIAVTTKVTDSRGYSTSSSQNITVYAYYEPSVVPAGGNSKVICGRCDQNGTLKSNGTRVHIEAGRIISTLNSKNKGKLDYEVFDSSGTSVGSGTVVSNVGTENAGASVTTGEIVSDLTSTYTVVLTATDDFGNSNTFNIVIPTDSVTVHIKRFGNGMGLGMYNQGADRLDLAWALHAEKAMYPILLTSHEKSATSEYYSHFLPVPRYTQNDILSGTGDSYPFTTYIQAWLKQVCADYGTRFSGYVLNAVGTATPAAGLNGTIMANISDPSDTTAGMPNTSTGMLIPHTAPGNYYTGAFVRFGTVSGTFWYEEHNPHVTSLNITYSTNSIISSLSNLGMSLRSVGKIATLTFDPTFTSTAGGSDYVKVASINSSRVRPLTDVKLSVPAQSSSNSNYMITVYVDTSGNIKIYKNTTSTAHYCGTMSWIIA